MKTLRLVRLLPVLLLAGTLAACPSGGDDPVGPEELRITTTSLPAGAIGEAYSAGVNAEGGDGEYDWDLSAGTLPPGLDLSVEDLTDDDVLITGVPTEEGDFVFTLRVRSDDGQQRTRNFGIHIEGEPEPITIETLVLPPALAGRRFSTHLEASGGDGESYTWSVVGGALPDGLQLIGDSIEGTPSSSDTVVLTLQVSSGGFQAQAPFTLKVVANRLGSFDITTAPVVPVPAAVQPLLDAAVARWQEIIVGDEADATIPLNFFDSGDCLGFGSILNGTAADDMIILINIAPIDGPGQVLGQASPCVVRNNNLPFAGILTLDSEDLLALINLPGTDGDNAVVDLFIHEIGHVLGFGSLWEFGAVDLIGGSTDDPRFTGAAAVAEYEDLGGTGNVPLENTGGSGTARSHWRETEFGTEVLTGFASAPGTVQPMSRMSIASIGDLGYDVDLDAADPYVLPAPQQAAGARERALGWDEVPHVTIRRIEDR